MLEKLKPFDRLITFSEFNDETLINMQKIVEKKEEIKDFNRNNAIYSISKYYIKLGLANIKFILSLGQGSVPRDKKLSDETSGQDSPCILYKGMSKSCPNSVHETKKTLSHLFVKKGEIKKWF
jgi:hypothetical protein